MTNKTREKNTSSGKKTSEKVIYIANKPPMRYVLAVMTEFNNGSNKVVIKARGRAITTAVDTVEITRNRFVKDIKVREIKIGTENITNETGKTVNVSSIEIYITNK